jgi:hypothetical protein
MGGSVNLIYTENPPEDCLACFLTWTNRLFHAEVNGWTSTYPLSASETASFTVPEGQPGDLLSIVANGMGPGGKGWVAYKYVFDAPEPPPERTPSPTVPPVPDTPTPTVEPATATPPPTDTPTPEPSPTALPEPDNSPPDGRSQPEYGPATFGTGYDYDSMQLLDPGHDFGPGVTILYAGWPYRGVAAGTEYEYEWYRNGQLLETNRNMLFHDVGHTFDFYTPDPGAQQPLKPGNYSYRVKIKGQPVLSAECVVR